MVSTPFAVLSALLALSCAFDSDTGHPGANTIGGNDSSTTGTSAATFATDTEDDETTASKTTSGVSATETGSPASTGHGDSTATTSESSTGSGQLPDGLVEQDLLARWYLDEAAAGMAPALARDDTEEPLDLPIAFAGRNPFWVEDDGQRGLRWSAVGVMGGPLATVAGSKFALLEGRPTLTIEFVAAVDAVASNGSRLFHIGSGNDMGDFSVRSGDIGSMSVVLDGSAVAGWPVDLVMIGRSVFHVVFDTTLAQEDDRVRLYVNGEFVAPEMTSPPAQGSGIALSNDPYLSLGNREDARSIEGAVYYAAVYARVLSDAEIEHDAEVLLTSDDR